MTSTSSQKRFSVIRDPVHGDVYLTHEELRLLDTPQMQRLRGVRQLGTAYLVYPGALHTRFDHSLGTLHCAARMIESLNLSYELNPAGCLRVPEEEARVIRLAALLHDVTHIPFGHNIEDQGGMFRRHDSAQRFEHALGAGTGAGRVLTELGVREEVLAVLSEGQADGPPVSVPPYWHQIISETISADNLDYLARDAYFTGLKLAVDGRVTSYFRIERASGNLFIDLAKHDLLREDILSEIVRLLEARYYFSERVYYHHAKVSAGALVARAVELAIGAGVIGEEDLYDETDASILDTLTRSVGAAEDGVRRRVEKLVDDFRARRLYKRACVFPRYENESVQSQLVSRFFSHEGAPARAAAEERIADLVRFSSGRDVDVIVYCPAQRMQLKEARIQVRWPGVPQVAPLSTFAERVPRLADLERSYRNLWKFYVFADTADPKLLARVRDAAREELSGATNAYDIN